MSGEAPVASGIRAFADDVAAVFASQLAAAPRAWVAVALAGVGAAGWLDPRSLPVVALVAGCVVATALPRRVPAAAALIAAIPVALTYLSDTIQPPFREPLETWTPALACAVVAAWAVGTPVREGRWFRVGAIAASLGTTVAGSFLLSRTDSDAYGAILTVNCIVAVLVAGSPGAWIGSLLVAGTLFLREVSGLEPDAMARHLFHPVGTALAVTITAAAAVRAVCGRPVDGEEPSARCVLAIRRHALLATVVGVTVFGLVDPLWNALGRLWDGAVRTTGDVGAGFHQIASRSLPGSATVFFVATHLAALDGLSKGIARASVAGAVAGGVHLVVDLWTRMTAPAGAAPAGSAEPFLWAAAIGAFVLLATLYARISARRIPALRVGPVELATAAAPVLVLAVTFEWGGPVPSDISVFFLFVNELLLSAVIHRLAVAHVPTRGLLAGTAVATAIVVAAASPQFRSVEQFVGVSIVLAGTLGRIALYIAILRLIRSLTPVPDDHPILADFATDLRRPAAPPAS